MIKDMIYDLAFMYHRAAIAVRSEVSKAKLDAAATAVYSASFRSYKPSDNKQDDTWLVPDQSVIYLGSDPALSRS